MAHGVIYEYNTYRQNTYINRSLVAHTTHTIRTRYYMTHNIDIHNTYHQILVTHGDSYTTHTNKIHQLIVVWRHTQHIPSEFVNN